jgi:hypothetical protein
MANGAVGAGTRINDLEQIWGMFYLPIGAADADDLSDV